MRVVQKECLEFDSTLFTAFVEMVVVSGTKKDVRLTYVMRDGEEYGVDGQNFGVSLGGVLMVTKHYSKKHNSSV